MTFWTEERLGVLKRLVRDGKTGTEIAEALGGITRNAVIGKIHREKLCWCRRVSKERLNDRRGRAMRGRKSQQRYAVVPREMKTEFVPVMPDHHPARTKSVLELETGDCRWPYTVNNRHVFGCPCHAMPGSQYCAAHHARAYNGVPVSVRKVSHLKAQEFA